MISRQRIASKDGTVDFTVDEKQNINITDIKLGDELLSEAITEPTLDRWLDNNPKNNTDQDYLELVLNLRRKREMFIIAEQKKKEPKIEGENDEQI